MSLEQLWAPWRLEYILAGKDVEPCDPARLLPGGDPQCFLCRSAAEGCGGSPPEQATSAAGKDAACATPGPDDPDRRHGIVSRGPRTIVVLNRYPYNNGHLLVAPQRHVARLDELDDATQLELFQAITRMVGVLERVMQPQGFNIGVNLGRAAGAGLPGHLHWHIVPRWVGDTNFMPAIAGVHTIPQSLDALWEMLAAEMQRA